ncbi:MAG: hypothetical protein JRJ33_03070 [Deltaproteobacteria bacterium]|nr:hypothetical protein [Deltaproteobacteria bacterium]
MRLTQKLGKKGRFAKVSEICAVMERSLSIGSNAFALGKREDGIRFNRSGFEPKMDV